MTILTTYQLAETNFKDEECIICFDEYTDKTPVYLLGCKHLIHEPCLKNQVECPFCRQAIAPIQAETKTKQSWSAFFRSLIPTQCLPRSYQSIHIEAES